MNQDVAIEVQHISKSFKISYDKSKTLKDKIIFAKKDKYRNFAIYLFLSN